MLPNLSQLSIGARPDIFKPVNAKKKPFQTGVYVFAIDPFGEVYLALGRKVPPGLRVPFKYKGSSPAANLTGAAGTAPEFHGKWTSLGGGADAKSKHILDAALIELSDEAAIPRIKSREVFLPWMSTPFDRTRHKLVCIQVEDITSGNTPRYIFSFLMPNWGTFFQYFPEIDRPPPANYHPIGQKLVKSSHGEIDATASFTDAQLKKYQAKEVANGNNYVTAYALHTLNTHVQPALVKFLSSASMVQYGRNLLRMPNFAVGKILSDKTGGPRRLQGKRAPARGKYYV
jgi:hypothetical protein